jgi:hypothetical protein
MFLPSAKDNKLGRHQSRKSIRRGPITTLLEILGLGKEIAMKKPRTAMQFFVALCALAAAAAMLTGVRAAASRADGENTVAALDAQYQEAVKKNDAATMERILADDFVLVTGTGRKQTKADLLKESSSGEITYEHQGRYRSHRPRVERHGCGYGAVVG